MSSQSPISLAIEIVGLSRLARGLGVSHQAVRKWDRAGLLPRTEWTGETTYAAKIEALTDGRITRAALLDRTAVRAQSPTPQPAEAAHG